MEKLKKISVFLTILVFGGIILLFLYQHLKLGLVRFLDLDEPMHLHWAFNAYSGRLPYKDFLCIFTPFYIYMLAPLIYLSGKTFTFVLAARILTFIFYCIGVVFLFLIAKKGRSLFFALFTVLIFVYLPLPADKWLEVRPDGVGTILALIGTWFLIKSLESVDKKIYFMAGFFTAAGVVVNPKLLFYPISISIVAFFDIVWKPQGKLKKWLFFFLGASVPAAFLLLLFFAFGDARRAIFSAFIFQKYAGTLYNAKFPIAPNQFFYPNEIYYGSKGYNFNYFANLFIYLTSSMAAIISLISFPAQNSREKALTKLLLALLFLTNLIGFIKFFPLKFTQYLIGVSPFVSLFFSEFVGLFWKKAMKKGRIVAGAAFLAAGIFLGSLTVFGFRMNEAKAIRTNEEAFGVLQNAKENLAEDEYVWDLTGNSLFYKDPYYVCCLPYGDYFAAFKFPLPSLEAALREHKVAHIFFTYPGRLATVPAEHLKIINQYYVTTWENYSIMFAGANVVLGEEKKEEQFELIVDGWYKIYLDDRAWPIEELQKSVHLNKRFILSNPIYLAKGKYTLTNLSGKKLPVKLLYSPE